MNPAIKPDLSAHEAFYCSWCLRPGKRHHSGKMLCADHVTLWEQWQKQKRIWSQSESTTKVVTINDMSHDRFVFTVFHSELSFTERLNQVDQWIQDQPSIISESPIIK